MNRQMNGPTDGQEERWTDRQTMEQQYAPRLSTRVHKKNSDSKLLKLNMAHVMRSVIKG